MLDNNLTGETGNAWKDLLLGTAGGLANLGDQKGTYYINANYKGDGLADTDLGYMVNYDYKNPYDMVNMLSAMWGGNNKGLPSSISGRFKNKLGNFLGGMTREDVDNNDTVFHHDIINTTGYKIPKTLSFLGPNIVGQPTTVDNKGYGYSLPTQNYNYNASWLKK